MDGRPAGRGDPAAGASRRWTPQEDGLVLALPAEQVAARTGRTLLAVQVRRTRLEQARPARDGGGDD